LNANYRIAPESLKPDTSSSVIPRSSASNSLVC